MDKFIYKIASLDIDIFVIRNGSFHELYDSKGRILL